MSRESRLALIKQIEGKRKSKVIAYITSDRTNLAAQIAGDTVSIIHDHLLSLKADKNDRLDLFIYSRGGQSDVPWTIVSMFREYCHKGDFNVLIPYRAHSAATVVALGADEIIMTKKAELGPIDATIMNGPYNPKEGNTNTRLPLSVEDVNGYFALIERINRETPLEKMNGIKELISQVHPLALGAVNRLLEETKLVGRRLLDTRAKPFTEEENKDIIKKLSSELYSHNHAINKTEALKYLGLKQVINAESVGLEEDLWNLYLEYREFFQLENPFLPEEHLIINNLEEYTWENLPSACIESNSRFDVCRKSLKVKKLRSIPPNINISLGNITLPPINISNLPAGLDPTQLNNLVQAIFQVTVQQCLNVAAQAVLNNLLKSLPQVGFEHITFNSGWKLE